MRLRVDVQNGYYKSLIRLAIRAYIGEYFIKAEKAEMKFL